MITNLGRSIGLLCLAVAAMLAVGCGNADESSHGIVQFDDGQPIRSGGIEFRSLSDGSRYASRIAADGTFTLADLEGVPRCPPGDYEVVVVQIVLTEDLAAEDHDHGRTVPRRYADYYTSGLRATKMEGSTDPIRVTLQADSEITSSSE